MSSAVTYSSQSSPSTYTFQADADNNVAVYYGTTADTQAGGLLALCQDSNVDIVILSFVYDFFAQGGYPTLNFGPACSGPNAAQAAAAPGLMDCTGLAPEISACQSIGKKVLVSLGGYIANSSFSSDDQAEQFAATLWNLFGAGTGDDPQLRPFGSVVVDGFDIDNENHDTSYYETFAMALRYQYTLDPSKAYYLSAAPQCPLPDESIPVWTMINCDFVWVQFYNNPSCNLDSDGFQASFAAWSANFSGDGIVPAKPRVYIGAAAFEGAGSGYVPGSGLSVPISMARELYVDNLGGIMLWDGSEAMVNVDQYGVDYLEYAKAALQG
jgi:chitinase